MPPKVNLTIEIILHATEDPSKIGEALFNAFEVDLKEFEIENVYGHFDNPITILKKKFTKNNAEKLISKLISKTSNNDLEILEQELDQMDTNSGLEIRISKQDFIRGRVSYEKKDSMKLTITAPVYKKNEVSKVYRDILNIR